LNYQERIMKRTNVLLVAGIAVSLFTAQAVYAAPASILIPVHAMFSKTKMVKLSLRNDTDTPIEVAVGDKVMTLEPGKPVNLSLAVGTRIVANSATPNHAAGALIGQVITEHEGTTISIR
jgi:hypothetical protein